MYNKGLLCGVLAATVVAGTAMAEEWRGWNIHVEDYPVSHGMERFAELVEERTDGALTGQIFHSGVLGSQPDAIEQPFAFPSIHEHFRPCSDKPIRGIGVDRSK